MFTAAGDPRRPVANQVAVSADGGLTFSRDLVVFRPLVKRRAVPQERARRVLNVVVAAIGLIVTAPVLLLIAIAIKLTSRGPVLYRQTRVGLDRRTAGGGNFRRHIDYGGKLFTIYKFRTMRAAPRDAQQVWAQKADPRITPVGHVLRKFRLDELPQLVNVLRGDMNVVGPRPEQPDIFMMLRDQDKIDRYQDRQRILPGITGWAQVNLAYDSCVEDVRRKVELDLEYAKRQSVSEDLRIMLRTLPVMAFRKGGM